MYSMMGLGQIKKFVCNDNLFMQEFPYGNYNNCLANLLQGLRAM